MTRHPKVKAIGEIGLDYYWKEVPRDLQRRSFGPSSSWPGTWTCPSSSTTGRPTATALPSSGNFRRCGGVFHCFSGSAEDAKTLVKLGWHLSFTGTITFKNARKAPEVIAAVPWSG